MTGWFACSLSIGKSTVLTIVLQKLQRKSDDNGLTIEIRVEVTRKVSQ